MKGAADNAISASSLYQAADGIDLLAPRAEEQRRWTVTELSPFIWLQPASMKAFKVMRALQDVTHGRQSMLL